MFLKTSLEEKLKRSLSEYNTQPEEVKFKYSPPKNQSFRLFNSKNDKLSFPRDHKKFNDDDIPLKAQQAKEFVKALIDPDILEIRQKRWNISAKPELNERTELKKTLFEVSHGLKDFKVVPPKEKKIELGTDTRNYCYEGWNGSSLLEGFEKKSIEKDNLENAKLNTLKYWKKTNDLRIAESLVDLVEDKDTNKKKVLKKYQNPVTCAKEYNNILSSIRKNTNEMRENLREEVAYENPAATQFKIDAIVYKRMYSTVKNELDHITGKKTHEEKCKECRDIKRIEKKILKEEPDLHGKKLKEKIEYELREEKKKNREYEIEHPRFRQHDHHHVHSEDDTRSLNQDIELLSGSKFDKIKKGSFKYEDTYPPDYENFKKTLDNKKKDEFLSSLKKDKISFKPEEEKNVHMGRSTYAKNITNFNTQRSPQKTYFNQNMKTYLKSLSTIDPIVKYEYTHPGTYTEFAFKEKILIPNTSNSYDVKEKKIMAWSCCMNNQKDSLGCNRKLINRLKWNLDSIP